MHSEMGGGDDKQKKKKKNRKKERTQKTKINGKKYK